MYISQQFFVILFLNMSEVNVQRFVDQPIVFSVLLHKPLQTTLYAMCDSGRT